MNLSKRSKRRFGCFELLEDRRVLASNPLLDPFTWQMTERTIADEAGRLIIPNTAQWANPGQFDVQLDVKNFVDAHVVAPEQVTVRVFDPVSGVLIRDAGEVIADSEHPTWFRLSLPEGNWAVQVMAPGVGSDVITAEQVITVDDLLVIAIGDSYASGEGNPEVPVLGDDPAQWLSAGTDASVDEQNRQHRISHRSSFAASALAASALEQSDPHTSVTFLFLASSGAEISEGVLGSYAGLSGEVGFDSASPMAPQIAQISNLIGDREIEVMTISVGGNDIGFTNAIAGLLLADPRDPDLSGIRYGQALALLKDAVLQGDDPANPVRWEAFIAHLFPNIEQTLRSLDAFIPDQFKPIDDFTKLFTELVMDTSTVGLNGLLEAYQQLDDQIDSLVNPPDTVLITPYPDPLTEMVDGEVVQSTEVIDDLDTFLLRLLMGGSLLNTIDLEGDEHEIQWARQNLIDPLNARISEAAEQLGWTLVDSFVDQFAGHGYSAGDEAWFVTATESVIVQGPDSTLETTGTLHPNRLGHTAIAGSLATAALDALSDTVFPLTNSVNRFDVNNSQEASPIDALVILNLLAREGSGDISTLFLTESLFYDVNRDNLITPIDALQVINFLSRVGSIVAGGEGDDQDESAVDDPLDPLSQFFASF